MNFKESQKTTQIKWWKKFSNQTNWENEPDKWGIYNKKEYSHIIKKNNWNRLLWEKIQTDLDIYLRKGIQPHTSVNNLLSSWVAAANLYFPTRINDDFKDLLLGFLKLKVSSEIIKINGVELEFAFTGMLSPDFLLGEKGGNRGSGQTSPDVAFLVETKNGQGVILTECKYTEHSFYRCSARRRTDRGNKKGNPSPEKCMQAALSCNHKTIPCHQTVWGRKYMDHFDLSEDGKKVLTRCPSATAGYQLMRQQALANGIKKSGKFDLVVSSVALDRRNTTLISSLKTSGVKDFQTGWSKIYKPGANFISWHHQEWVEYVRNHFKGSEEIKDWLSYMQNRYGY